MKMKYKIIIPLSLISLLALGCNKANPTPTYSSDSTTNQSQDQSTNDTTTPPADQSTTPPATPAPDSHAPETSIDQPPASQTPAKQSFTVNASDNSADLTTIKVAKGAQVSITFNVDGANTYHGGLDFRSDKLNTGTIAPGASKTVSFTADSSFTLTPYWPASNIKKPYVVSIVVQ